MTCHAPQETVELLGPAALGALGAEERASLREHLDTCADCRDELRSLGRVVMRLSVLQDRVPGMAALL